MKNAIEDQFLPASAALRREIRALLRSPRVFLILGTLTALMGILCACSYPLGADATSRLGVQYARTMVNIQLFGLWLTALTAIPAMAVLGVHQERISGTLEHVACTSLRPRTLYLSKTVALVGLYMLAAAATLPVSGIAFFLAGVEVGPYLGKLATLLCFSTCMIAVGIQVSAHVSGTIIATVLAIAIGLTAGGGLMTLLTGFHLGAVTGFMLAFTVVIILRPDFLRRVCERATFYGGNKSTPRPPVPSYRPAMDIQDGVNPIVAREQLHALHHHDYPRTGCIMFPLGLLSVLVSFFGQFGTPSNPTYVAVYLSDLLLYGPVTVVTAAIFLKDSDQCTLDSIRGTLISEREFLNGKVRAAWRAFVPLLAGFYMADGLLMISSIGWVEPLRLSYHVLLVALNVPEFHIVILLSAAGTTFGRSAKSMVAWAILWSIPGLLLPGIAADHLEHALVSSRQGPGYLGRFGSFVSIYAALVGAALMFAMFFARWRLRRLWQGAAQ